MCCAGFPWAFGLPSSPSHTLSGNITFTQNWTIPQQPNGVPFVVAANSTVTGQTLAGVTNAPLSLVVGKDAVATFDTINTFVNYHPCNTVLVLFTY